MTLSEAEKILSAAGIDSALYDARELFRQYGDFAPGEIILRNAECHSAELKDAIERRRRREPLQYILGYADFYRERYKVTPDCLIPREDTEILVDYAVRHLPRGARFLDLCTGSGCVALSTLSNTSDTKAVAVDISLGALDVAEENAEALGLSNRIEFVCSDVLKEKREGDFFALLSNPPYVSSSSYKALADELYHEPREAFLGGEDGGDFYRALTPMYLDILEKGGFIAYEIGYDQAELMRKIAEELSLSCEIIKDLSGNDRVAVLRK